MGVKEVGVSQVSPLRMGWGVLGNVLSHSL